MCVEGCEFVLHQVGTEDGRVTKGFSLTPKEEGVVPGEREEASLAQSHPLPTWEQCLTGRQEEHVFEKLAQTGSQHFSEMNWPPY